MFVFFNLDLESIGITHSVIERVQYLSEHTEIFKHYSLDGHQPKEDFFTMNETQQKHALEILKEVPKLALARLQLAPSFMRYVYIYKYFLKVMNVKILLF